MCAIQVIESGAFAVGPGRYRREAVASYDACRDELPCYAAAIDLRQGSTSKAEDDMGIPPALFICLFLAALGLFFLGVGVLWWVSLQARAMQRGAGSGGRVSKGSDQIAN